MSTLSKNDNWSFYAPLFPFDLNFFKFSKNQFYVDYTMGSSRFGVIYLMKTCVCRKIFKNQFYVGQNA